MPNCSRTRRCDGCPTLQRSRQAAARRDTPARPPIRELRADPALATVPVMVLSARAGEDARLEGLSRGADDYLVKPFSARELLGSVAAALKSESMRQRVLEQERRFRTLRPQGGGAGAARGGPAQG